VVPSFLFKNDLPKRSTLLIEDATIITMDNQRRILKNGYVAIDNGIIVSSARMKERRIILELNTE